MAGAELRGVRKYFPENGVEALAGVSFDLRPGEIHALVGENGAGKSTLMHILAGQLEPSAGKILIDGTERKFAVPADALRAGIGLVRQHPRTVPGFALWEDCALGAEPTIRGIVDRKRAKAAVRELSCRWGFELDPDAPTESLAVSQRQKAAVLALLMRNVRYILLDEPTAVLAPRETERLFELLQSLKAAGHGIVLISHKLPETLRIADRVTILRRGTTVGSRNASGLRPDELRALMFGEGESDAARPRTARRAEIDYSMPALKVAGLETDGAGHPTLRGIDLEVPRGAILGVAGVRESGLETLELAVSGLLKPTAGSIELFGERIEGEGPRAYREAGGAYVPGDRMGTALAPRLPLADNLAVHPQARAPRFGSLKGLRDRARRLMAEARVGGDPRQAAAAFSGGTLQRLILARELAENPAFVLLSEPGWGLDERSRTELAERVRRSADNGKAVLLLSTDLDELMGLSDEIVTLRDGRVSGRFRRGDSTTEEEIREAIGAAMIGAEVCDDR